MKRVGIELDGGSPSAVCLEINIHRLCGIAVIVDAENQLLRRSIDAEISNRYGQIIVFPASFRKRGRNYADALSEFLRLNLPAIVNSILRFYRYAVSIRPDRPLSAAHVYAERHHPIRRFKREPKLVPRTVAVYVYRIERLISVGRTAQ